jgi:cell division protein FtsL
MSFDPFSMVVAIVALSVGAGVINNWIKMKQATRRNADQDRELGEVKAEVAKLSDRVRVLEKLAVDADRQLSAEINRLR